MKTTTIYQAYQQASYEVRQRMQSYPARHSQKYFILLRQKATFEAALLARIEAGDRAREALKQVEYIQYGDDGEAYCPWCGFPMLGPDNPQPHSEICMRQIALGLQEPQP